MPRQKTPSARQAAPPSPRRPSSLLDTRIIYCGDCLEQLRNLPDRCVDLIYIDPAPVSQVERPFSSSLSLRAEGNSNRNYEVFWGETKEDRDATR